MRVAGRADWWEGAQARRVLAICSCFMVQRVLDVPPPRQPGARTRGCIAGAGRREAGRSGRRWAGLAGWCARWVGGDERHCKGHCTKYVCPAHTAHPRPSALCPTPQHATPLPPAAPAPPTSFLCGVPCLAIGLDQDIWQKPRARRRGHAEIHILFLCGWGGRGCPCKTLLIRAPSPRQSSWPGSVNAGCMMSFSLSSAGPLASVSADLRA